MELDGRSENAVETATPGNGNVLLDLERRELLMILREVQDLSAGDSDS